jgi:hypothetical protein
MKRFGARQLRFVWLLAVAILALALWRYALP